MDRRIMKDDSITEDRQIVFLNMECFDVEQPTTKSGFLEVEWQ